MTASQKQAIQDYWSMYGIEPEGVLDLHQIFTRQAPVIMEIGFGMGDSLVEMALSNPENNYLGVEVHSPGVGSILSNIHKLQLTNLKVLSMDAVDLLSNYISNESLNGFVILFPDPWPKKRHHKRRLINQSLIDLLSSKLVSGGSLHIATDWQEYAFSVKDLLTRSVEFKNKAECGGFIQKQGLRASTKFERRGEKLGHDIFDLLFEKV